MDQTTLDAIYKVIFWKVLTAFGGPAVVLGGLFTWLGKRYLDRRLESERDENKSKHAELEAQLKQVHDRTILTFKAQFEKEFEGYQKVWRSIMKIRNNLLDASAYYKDEAHHDLEKYELANTSMYDLGDSILEIRPFISETIFKQVDGIMENFSKLRRVVQEKILSNKAILKDGEKTTEEYTSEAYISDCNKVLDDVREKMDFLADAIRERISSIHLAREAP